MKDNIHVKVKVHMNFKVHMKVKVHVKLKQIETEGGGWGVGGGFG